MALLFIHSTNPLAEKIYDEIGDYNYLEMMLPLF